MNDARYYYSQEDGIALGGRRHGKCYDNSSPLTTSFSPNLLKQIPTAQQGYIYRLRENEASNILTCAS